MSEKCRCKRALAVAAGELTASCPGCGSLPDWCDCDELVPARRLVLTAASLIEPEPIVWAWVEDEAGRIPAGSLGLFAGREGTGKSSFLIWMAAQITRGNLPGSFFGTPRAVIYVAVEDSWKFTLVPRLMAAGADLTRVFRAEVQVLEGDTVSLSVPADLKMLEEAITENQAALVVLDPLMSAISDSLDTHVNRQVRMALDPMVRMADRSGAIIAGIAHFNKSTGTDASSLVTGSGAFKDVARFIFAFATDEDDGTQVITQTKNSLGRSDLPSLDYRVIEAVVETPTGETRVGKFVPGGIAGKSVHDILAAQKTGDKDAKTTAEDFLRNALAGGPRKSKDVEEEARVIEGIAKRTLDRARRDLGLPVAKRSDGWWVSLPEHENDLRSPAETPKEAKIADLGTDGNQANTANSASPGVVGSVGILPEPVPAGLWSDTFAGRNPYDD
jgi:hypothetical protein